MDRLAAWRCHVIDLSGRGVIVTAIRLAVGVGEQTWNREPVTPGELAVISPINGRTQIRPNRVRVPKDTKVFQDCGAFSDTRHTRLSFADALKRQEEHARKYGYEDQIIARATYDMVHRPGLLDDLQATDASVAAARFLDGHRNGLPLIVTAQGHESEYLSCAQRLMAYLKSEDIFGLGGWAILGQRPAQMMPAFLRVIAQVIPFLGSEGMRQLHIWGVIYPPALGHLLHLCDEQRISLSTDSIGPQLKPNRDKDWGYGDWRDSTYKAHPVETRGLERIRHVNLTREWLSNFRQTQYYRPIRLAVRQQKFEWI